MIARAARFATGLAVAFLGGNRQITLRSRAVVRDQVQGLGIAQLVVSGEHLSGVQAVSVRCRAVDGLLPAGTGLRSLDTGELLTVFQETRLQPPSVWVPIVGALGSALPVDGVLTVEAGLLDVPVPAIRRDEPNTETEAGVLVAQSVYQVAAANLPYRIDANWLVVDGGVPRRVSQVQPLRAGGEVVAWRIFAEGAG